MEKSIYELKAEFMYLCVRGEKTINSFDIAVIIFKAYKKCKSAERLTKTYFFLYFRDRPKNGEGNKQRRRRKYMCKSN